MSLSKAATGVKQTDTVEESTRTETKETEADHVKRVKRVKAGKLVEEISDSYRKTTKTSRSCREVSTLRCFSIPNNLFEYNSSFLFFL